MQRAEHLDGEGEETVGGGEGLSSTPAVDEDTDAVLPKAMKKQIAKGWDQKGGGGIPTGHGGSPELRHAAFLEGKLHNTSNRKNFVIEADLILS